MVGSLNEGFLIFLYLWTPACGGYWPAGGVGGVGRAGTCCGGPRANIKKSYHRKRSVIEKNENSPNVYQ